MSCFSLPHGKKAKCGCWFPALMAFPANQGEALLSPPREELLCSILTKHFIYPMGVDPTISIQRWRYVSLFFDSCVLRSPGYSEISGTVTDINPCNYINQFSQTVLWEVSHCHPWRVNLWAPSAWCLFKAAMLSLQAPARDSLMGQHLLNTGFRSLQLAKFVLKACLGVWQGFWWLVA